MNKSDIKFETKRGSGPGGQHRNKSDTCVTATHIPTGIQVTIDGRSQKQNKRQAIAEIKRRIDEQKQSVKAAEKKSNRDHKIHNTKVIRTYNLKRGTVKDHRSGRTASLPKMLNGKVCFRELSNR